MVDAPPNSYASKVKTGSPDILVKPTEPTPAKKQKKKSNINLPTNNRVNPGSVLFIPNEQHPRVLDTLKKLPEASAREITRSVKRHLEFPSGALLVQCKDAKIADQLRKIADSQGIKEKKRESNPPSVRIHDVPKDTSFDDLRTAISEKFNDQPINVSMHPYRNNQDVLFAVVTTSIELYKAMATTSRIRIGWAYCRIDATIRVSRCKNCGLLGHSEKSCFIKEAPQVANSESYHCTDCSAFNERRENSAKDSGFTLVLRKRPTGHKPGSSACLTLRNLKKKLLPVRQPAAAESLS